jgi:phage recombination protein Bet
MNAIARIPQREGALVTAEQADALRNALKTSLYPGASDESVDMVLAYCQAAGYDPMKKPVHIVPMKVSTGRKDANGWDIKETRDVVMPGIGQYRTDAVRTGQYAGCSEPEFGPTKTLAFKRERWVDGPNRSRQKQYADDSIEYPEWCRVTITKIVGGVERQFTAKEFWLENYAEKGDDGAPNSMWEKRPFAQLAKCTEAQALRKAFPETVSAAPTADEMEGKALVIEGQASPQQNAPALAAPAELPLYSDTDFAANLPKWWDIIESGRKSADDLIAMLQTKARFTSEQLKEIRTPPRDDSDDGDTGDEGAQA